MLLRPAATADGAALCAIYRPYVMETAITFICKEPTSEGFSEKIASLMPQYPFIVCERAVRRWVMLMPQHFGLTTLTSGMPSFRSMWT